MMPESKASWRDKGFHLINSDILLQSKIELCLIECGVDTKSIFELLKPISKALISNSSILVPIPVDKFRILLSDLIFNIS